MDVTLGPADLDDGELRPYATSDGRHVLVARLGAAFHAIDDMCNHAGCLLSGGWLSGRSVVCPCHEYEFDLPSGKNVTFPRLCDDQPSFPLRVEDGRIVVTLPDRAR